MGDPLPDGEAQHNVEAATDSVQPQMTMHPIGSYSGMPMHMYPFPPGMVPTQPARTKRRQVKNACTNCQKACKKCDDARPCLRCVKYGISEECIDSQRKERQKGIKRGPYKKRDGKSRAANSVEQQLDVNGPPTMVIPPAVAATNTTPPMSYAPVAYQPTFYGPKPGEAPVYYPPIYFAPVPPPHGTGQDGEPQGYPPPHAQFYSAAFLAPYPAQPYPPPYMMHHARPEGQMQMAQAHHQYAPYPQVYPRPPTRDSNGDVGAPVMDGRRDMRVEHGRMGEGMAVSHGKA